jgi:hypothetical protein
MKLRSSASLLFGGSFLAAGLCTAIADDGWWVWIPVALAVAVVTHAKSKFGI